MTDKIIIIGGGIGGLAAALALLTRGLDVEVYEQAPELKEVGAGIQISSNGTRVLYELGLKEALARVQVMPLLVDNLRAFVAGTPERMRYIVKF